MALTNAYASPEQLKTEKGISDAIDDGIIEIALNAASRQIDGACGRRFWQDGAVVARDYFPDSALLVCTDDISTTDGLIVKVDTDLSGTFETTLTITTDFLLHPRNANLEIPIRPFTEIVIVPTGSTFFPNGYGRPSVQVTAKFGWPAIPDDITKACLIQAQMLASSNEAAFGVAALATVEGAGMRASPWNPLARALIGPYAKPAVG